MIVILRNCAWFAAGCVIWSSLTCAVLAQGNRDRGPYRPVRPPLSPYLNLGRADAAPVDNYNAFVRPEVQLQETLDRQQAALRDLTTPPPLPLQTPRTPVATAPTGTASVFFDMLHYYPLQPRFNRSVRMGRRR
jgi:hypothetical protein